MQTFASPGKTMPSSRPLRAADALFRGLRETLAGLDSLCARLDCHPRQSNRVACYRDVIHQAGETLVMVSQHPSQAMLTEGFSAAAELARALRVLSAACRQKGEDPSWLTMIEARVMAAIAMIEQGLERVDLLPPEADCYPFRWLERYFEGAGVEKRRRRF